MTNGTTLQTGGAAPGTLTFALVDDNSDGDLVTPIALPMKRPTPTAAPTVGKLAGGVSGNKRSQKAKPRAAAGHAGVAFDGTDCAASARHVLCGGGHSVCSCATDPLCHHVSAHNLVTCPTPYSSYRRSGVFCSYYCCTSGSGH